MAGKWRPNWGSVVQRGGNMKKFLADKMKASKLATEAAHSRPDDVAASNRETAVLEVLSSFHLDGGKSHTSLVVARSGDRMLGGREDRGIIAIRWLRNSDAGFGPIEGVESGFYQPSLDDVGGTILCQCMDAENESSCTFAEYGPVVVDPAIESRIQQAVAKDTAVFEVEPVLQFGVAHELRVGPTDVVLVRLGGGEEAAGSAAEAEVARTPLKTARVVLSPPDVREFTIRFDDKGVAIALLAASNKERDVLAGCIRSQSDASAVATEATAEASATAGGAGVGAGAGAPEHATEVDDVGAGGGASAGDGSMGDDAEPAAVDSAAVAPAEQEPSAGSGPPPPPPVRTQPSAVQLEARLGVLSKRLQSEIAAKEVLEQELSIVRRERDAAKTSVAAIESESKAQQARAVKLGAQMDELRSAHSIVNGDVTRLRGELDESRAAQRALQDKLKAVETTAADFEAEALGLRIQCQSRQASVLSAQKQATTAERAVAEANAERDKATKALAEANARIEKLAAKLAKSAGRLDDLKSKMATAGSAREEDARRVRELEEEVAAANQRATAAEARIDVVTIEAEEARAKAAELQKLVDGASASRAAVEAQLEEAKAEAMAAMDEVDELTAKRNAAVRKAASLSKRMAKMMQEATPSEELEKVAHEKNELLVAAQVAREEARSAKEELEAFKAAQGAESAVATPAAAAPAVSPARPPSTSAGRSLFGIRLSSAPAAATAAGSPGVTVHTLSDSAAGKQNREMQRLICNLTDQLSDKEEALAEQRKTKDFLMRRMQELQAQVKALGGTAPAGE